MQQERGKVMKVTSLKKDGDDDEDDEPNNSELKQTKIFLGILQSCSPTRKLKRLFFSIYRIS